MTKQTSVAIKASSNHSKVKQANIPIVAQGSALKSSPALGSLPVIEKTVSQMVRTHPQGKPVFEAFMRTLKSFKAAKSSPLGLKQLCDQAQSLKQGLVDTVAQLNRELSDLYSEREHVDEAHVDEVEKEIQRHLRAKESTLGLQRMLAGLETELGVLQVSDADFEAKVQALKMRSCRLLLAPYPELKNTVNAICGQWDAICVTQAQVRKLPPRLQHSYECALSDQQQGLKQYTHALQAALEKAQAKAHAKGIPFDSSITQWVLDASELV